MLKLYYSLNVSIKYNGGLLHSTISDISTILVTMYYSRYVRL